MLSHLVGATGRVAVVDVETTGLYSADRIVEVAVVTLDAHGRVVEEFEALVDPGRDVGPVWLHGVTASMVAGAPRFEDLADHVAARLDGAVTCAHNLRFDQRMLLGELERCAMAVDWGLGVDTLAHTGSRLEVACRDAGIALDDAHRALFDARATAQLLVAHAAVVGTTPVPARVGPHILGPIRIVTRDGHQPADLETPFVVSLAGGLHAEDDVAPYEQLLAVALADLKLTPDERAELELLAADLELDAGQVGRAHRDFVGQLIDAALEDHVVTDEEYDQLCRVAALLDLEVGLVERRTEGLRSEAATIAVVAGMSVCFTGSATDEAGREIPREQLSALAEQAGLVPVRGVTRETSLLVAADPASRSGKAAKARKGGTPVAAVSDLLDCLASGSPLAVSVLSGSGTALVCSRCGDSWLAPRRSSNPLCSECRGATAAPRTRTVAATPPAPGATGAAVVETLTCMDCGADWERVVVRGRKPRRCPDCA